MSTVPKSPRKIDFWRWRQREPKAGAVRKSVFQMTLDETGTFPEARPVLDSKHLEEGDEAVRPDFAETRPEVGRLEPD
jgi:hypothetical protein